MKILALATVAAATLVAVPANAVVVTNATSIRITSALSDHLQVAEVQAFNFASTNVALGGTAIGSSTYASYSSADKAIDGNTGGNFYTDTIYHPAGSSSSEFLEISFAPASLSSLTIFGRTDCCSQRDMYNVQIFAGSNLLYSGVLNADNDLHSASVSFGSAVPEPTTWSMLIAGFGLVGAAARRRRLIVDCVNALAAPVARRFHVSDQALRLARLCFTKIESIGAPVGRVPSEHADQPRRRHCLRRRPDIHGHSCFATPRSAPAAAG